MYALRFWMAGNPTFSPGSWKLPRPGCERLIVIPYFLTVGLHLRRDLPKLVAAAKEKYPNFEIAVGKSLEGHPLMPSIILGRVQEALQSENVSQ